MIREWVYEKRQLKHGQWRLHSCDSRWFQFDYMHPIRNIQLMPLKKESTTIIGNGLRFCTCRVIITIISMPTIQNQSVFANMLLTFNCIFTL